MEFTRTDRGFKRMSHLYGTCGETVRVYESSAALAPHVWVAIRDADNNDEAHAHLDFETLQSLIDQLTWLRDNHYQVTGATNVIR